VLRTYLPAIVFLGLGGLVGALFVTAGSFLGPKPKTPTTYQADPYESGMPSEVHQGFDIEVVFLYPIAVQLRAFGTFALIETVVFIGLLMVALVYVWRRGALEWR
jgi:NADH-quinone oxidoreductase subunit A